METKSEIRAEIRQQIKVMDQSVESLLDWAESDASDDRNLIEKLTQLQYAFNTFLTMID